MFFNRQAAGIDTLNDPNWLAPCAGVLSQHTSSTLSDSNDTAQGYSTEAH